MLSRRAGIESQFHNAQYGWEYAVAAATPIEANFLP
jgi:hypothetical protein